VQKSAIKANIYKQLTAIFREIFANKSITLSEDTTAKDIENWDSLTNMILIHAIESHFKFKFKFRDVVALKNVGELVEVIEQKMTTD